MCYSSDVVMSLHHKVELRRFWMRMIGVAAVLILASVPSNAETGKSTSNAAALIPPPVEIAFGGHLLFRFRSDHGEKIQPADRARTVQSRLMNVYARIYKSGKRAIVTVRNLDSVSVIRVNGELLVYAKTSDGQLNRCEHDELAKIWAKNVNRCLQGTLPERWRPVE